MAAACGLGGEQVAGGERREPGFSCQGGGDGVEGGQSVRGCGVSAAGSPVNSHTWSA